MLLMLFLLFNCSCAYIFYYDTKMTIDINNPTRWTFTKTSPDCELYPASGLLEDWRIVFGLRGFNFNDTFVTTANTLSIQTSNTFKIQDNATVIFGVNCSQNITDLDFTLTIKDESTTLETSDISIPQFQARFLVPKSEGSMYILGLAYLLLLII